MLRLLYSFFLTIFYIPYILIILIRIFLNKEHKSKFKEKLFFKNVRRPDGFLFWFHVASLGELNSIGPFIDYYLKKDEKFNFLITTVTLSSYNQFKKKFDGNKRVFHQFLPYDLNLLSNNFLNSWKPNVASFVDSEIWPNFIFNIKKKNIPLILLNGRITKKTLNRWMIFKKFSNDIFENFTLCISSSKETLEYLKLLNAKNIKYFGNIKFCSKSYKDKKIFDDQFKNLNDKKVWCAVSTHNNEEIFCSKVQKILKENIKESLCIIIPRHVNRTKRIYLKLKNLGFKVQIKNENDAIDNTVDIVIVNYYGAVDIFLSKIKNVFIGKSMIKKLVKVGGQNPIEASKEGCFIFHGPYVSNFSEIYDYLKSKGFSEEIKYPDELANKLIRNFNGNHKVVEKEKIIELETYSNSIFKNVINEYQDLINENFKT